MKTIAFALFGVATLISCGQNEKPENTNPADYAETHEKLIQNKEKDSVQGDSTNQSTNMPPQQQKSELDKQSGKQRSNQ